MCKNDTDCGAGECCYIQPEFIVVSKRQLVLPDQPNNKRDTGTGFVFVLFSRLDLIVFRLICICIGNGCFCRTAIQSCMYMLLVTNFPRVV